LAGFIFFIPRFYIILNLLIVFHVQSRFDH
jgi:hypothetical protein